jgi:hypothetical protein
MPFKQATSRYKRVNRFIECLYRLLQRHATRGAVDEDTNYNSTKTRFDVHLRIRIYVSSRKLNRNRKLGGANSVHRVVGAGIARTIYLVKVQANVLDKTWYAFDVCASGVAECNIAIVCACAPSLKAVTGRFFANLSSLASSKHSNGSGGHHKGKICPLLNQFFGEFLRDVNPSNPDSHPNYGTDTTISAGGSRRDSITHSAGNIMRNLSLRKHKNPNSLETPKRAGDLSSFSEAHEYGLDRNLILDWNHHHRHLPLKINLCPVVQQ